MKWIPVVFYIDMIANFCGFVLLLFTKQTVSLDHFVDIVFCIIFLWMYSEIILLKKALEEKK